MASGGLTEAFRHLPEKVREAAIAAADLTGLPDRGSISEVVILGRGVGAVAADVVAMVAERHCSVPVVTTGVEVPSWLSESSVALALSQLGHDRATVAAARRARAAGASVIAITAGSDLMSACSHWGVPVARFDPAAGPAVGLGVVTVPALVLLERLGLTQGMNRLILEAAAQLDARLRLIDSAPGRIAEIAAGIGDQMVVVCGAGALGILAARRWVQQLDNVAGVASVRRKAPVDSDDLRTWDNLGRLLPAGAAAVVLRHDFEPEGVSEAISGLGARATTVFEVDAAGRGPLAQLLDLVLVGDAVAAVAAQRRRNSTAMTSTTSA